MTTKHIRQRLDEIRRAADDCDHESAHAAEDGLRVDFITYVASLDGPVSLVEKAKLVASTSGIQFSRWCA